MRPPSTDFPRLTPAGVAALLLLMALCAAPYPFTTLILDLTRDLVFAARIAGGEDLPLRGPVINAMGHLGPGWFYLLAPVLATTGSIAATLLFVGLLAALKIPLAFALGRRLGGSRLGWAWAVAMLFPSWAIVSGMLATHTSLVETAVLAAALAALRVEARPQPGRFLLLGLTLALALHAHPSTLSLAPLLGLLMFRLHRGGLATRVHLRGWLLVALAAGLPFASSVYAEWRDGWPLMGGVTRYASGWDAIGDPLRLVLGGLLGGGFMLSEHLAVGPLQTGLRALLLGSALAALAGLALALRVPRSRHLLAVLGLALLLAWLGVYLLRPQYTPFYMVLAFWPIAAGVLAVSVAALLARQHTRLLGSATLGAMLVLATAASVLPIAAAERGSIRVSAPAILDVRRFDHPPADRAVLPVWRAERWSRRVCAETAPVVLHAELAALTEAGLALWLHLRCAGRDRVAIGGGADQPQHRHLLGLTPAQLEALALLPRARWRDSFTLAPARVIAGAGSERVPDGRRYPFRERAAGVRAEHAWTFATEPGETVVVSHLFRVYDDASTLEVLADGQAQAPLLASFASSAYRCADCSAPVRWTVRVRSGFPERVDIVIAAAPSALPARAGSALP